MSLASLGLVLAHVAAHGRAREADEGAAAHLYQLLMVSQMPIVLWFTARWLPREPRFASRVLVLQACAWGAALGALWWMEHVYQRP